MANKGSSGVPPNLACYCMVIISPHTLRLSLPVSQTGDCPPHPPLSISYPLFEGQRQHHQAQLLTCFLAIPCPQSLSPYSQVIPLKLIKKILALEYINMSQLLLEHYDNHDEAESPCCNLSTKSTRQPPVTNIVV